MQGAIAANECGDCQRIPARRIAQAGRASMRIVRRRRRLPPPVFSAGLRSQRLCSAIPEFSLRPIEGAVGAPASFLPNQNH